MKHGRVRILIGGDVEAARSGLFDLANARVDGTPVVTRPHLEMKQVYGNVRLFGNANREVDFFLLLVPFAAVV